MENDGFLLVKKRKSAQARLLKVGRADGSVDDVDVAIRKATNQLEDSGVIRWLIDRIIDSPLSNIQRVAVIGNGHFDAVWEAGAHQLALALKIREQFNTTMLFQEPFCTSAEAQWILSRDCSLREAKDLLVAVTDVGADLLFLVHGLHSLLNDYLWYNWGDRLRRIGLICNDYASMEIIGGSLFIEEEHQALKLFVQCATSIQLPMYGPLPYCFSGTSFIYLNDSAVIPELACERPVYSNSNG